MSWDDVFWHVTNFLLPAWALSLGITVWGSTQFRRQTQIRWIWRWLINALAGMGARVTALDAMMPDGGASARNLEGAGVLLVRGDIRDTLGEGTLWSARENAVYWVDILAPALNRLSLDDGQVSRWAMPAVSIKMSFLPANSSSRSSSAARSCAM